MHRMLVFPRFKYPKLVILFASYILAYFLLANRDFQFVRDNIAILGYLGAFIAGVFYSYGFTAGPAAATFLILAKSLDPFAAAIIGGLGSLLGDFLIFEFVRLGFEDEIQALSHTALARRLNIPFMHYLAPLAAIIFITSPLPDEIGVSMLAASKIPARKFAVISFLLNTLGILIILFLGA